MSSRLFLEVRERRGLAYYVFGSNSSFTDAGTLYAQAGVDLARSDEAVKVIAGEFRRMAEERVPADELEKARALAKGRFVLQTESPNGLILFGLRREVLNTALKVTGRLALRKSPVRLWNTLLLFEMMLLARDDWRPPSRDFAPHPDAHTRINQAISMVLASSHAVSVAEAAKACDMSRNAFSRLFTSAMGLPFAKYCLRHRLSAGAEQLARTDHPIKSIAMEWGFADASHFSQCFHKHYGCSPAEYRRRRQ